MTTRVLVMTVGSPARVIVQHRDASGEFDAGSPRDIAADSWTEVYVPDRGQVIVHELPKP